MRHAPAVLTLLALPVLATCGFVPGPFGDCDVTGTLSTVVEASGFDHVRVEAAAGSLVIQGDPDLTEVRAQGEACAPDSETLERIRLTDAREGDAIVLRAELPEGEGGDFFGGSDGSRLDLTVRVPARMTLDVRDGSGSTEIRGVAAVSLNDGSGSIRIQEIAGFVRVDDGSGSLRIARVDGDVEVEDGSGSIDLRDIGGSVWLDDGSGSIRGSEIEGSFVIEEDGSGSISAADVGGDFIVRDDGSGGIDYERVSGQVRIPRD